ncbi:unnamed protein product [Phytomonas sp. EM1]|nr:unnamed protein product [Phytomonas sp. EM1]|eukprot:CCW61326.1 unnamed protein product [Phytomonas sp. isolate EM1]
MQELVEPSVQANLFVKASQHIFKRFGISGVAFDEVPMAVDSHTSSHPLESACLQGPLDSFQKSRSSQQSSGIPSLFSLHNQHVYHPSTSTCDHTLLTSTNTTTASSNSSTPVSGSLNRSESDSSAQVAILPTQEAAVLQTLPQEAKSAGIAQPAFFNGTEEEQPPQLQSKAVLSADVMENYSHRVAPPARRKATTIEYVSPRCSPGDEEGAVGEAPAGVPLGIPGSTTSTPIHEPPSKHLHRDPCAHADGKAVEEEEEAQAEAGADSISAGEGPKPVSPTRRSRPALRHLVGHRARFVPRAPPLSHGMSQPTAEATTETTEETTARRETLRSHATPPRRVSKDPCVSQPSVGAPTHSGPVGIGGGPAPLCSSPAVGPQLREVPFARIGITRFVSYMCRLNQGGPIPSSDFHSHCMPPMSVESYVDRIVRYCGCSAEALLCGLMLLLKYSFHSGHLITVYNAHRLLITGIVLGIKMRDDTYFNNAHYGKIGGIRASEMCKLEVLFLEKMSWEMHISEVEYAVMCELLGELIRDPTQEELAAFKAAYPDEVEAYDLQKDEVDLPTHGSEPPERSSEEPTTQEDTEAITQARVLGAYRRHHWKVRIEPWLTELCDNTFRKKQEQAALEQRDWDAEEERWRRYREEDLMKVSQRSGRENSCWLSPIALDARDERTSSTGLVAASEAQSTTVDFRHHRTAATGASSGMFGIVDRVQELETAPGATSTVNLLHSSKQTTTPGSGINVNAQPYYYVSSRQKLQQKVPAASGTTADPPSSMAAANSNDGSSNIPHMRCSNWRNPTQNEGTFPFQRKQALSFGVVAPQSRYGDQYGGNKPANYPEGNGSSHMSCSNFVACQKSDPYCHPEDAPSISPYSIYSHRGADQGMESQHYQEHASHPGAFFPSAPLRGFPNHGGRSNSNVIYSMGANQKHAQGNVGSVGKKRSKPDAYVDRLYRD